MFSSFIKLIYLISNLKRVHRTFVCTMQTIIVMLECHLEHLLFSIFCYLVTLISFWNLMGIITELSDTLVLFIYLYGENSVSCKNLNKNILKVKRVHGYDNKAEIRDTPSWYSHNSWEITFLLLFLLLLTIDQKRERHKMPHDASGRLGPP